MNDDGRLLALLALAGLAGASAAREYDNFEVSADEDGFDEAMRKIDEAEDALIARAR